MKNYVYTPKLCIEQVDDQTQEVTKPSMSGTVTLRVPMYPERQKMRMIAYDVVDASAETKNHIAMMQMPAMVDYSKEFYIAVDLTVLEDGAKISNFEDLATDYRAEGVLQDVALLLARGMSPSKN